MAATDWSGVYRENVDAVSALAGALDADDLALRVPATPDWTVQQVLAHLAGGPADLLAGRMERGPSAAWPPRHVAERDEHSVHDLVAELNGSVDGLVAVLDGDD